ncbi:MAG: hypothetical protein KIT84_33370 [Labilithrix sp.]|nr:hypothetical protein [Labilithrix sp.]MCW5815938.1 hypothetical protein [Labilithrix sp.]
MGHESIDEHYGQALRNADVGQLIVAARRYLEVRRFDEAQSALLAAGRLQPREGEVYRWLGEVLLRRGDAERAEKVLEKAVMFGSSTNATVMLEQARSLIPTQHAAGEGAVADLFAQSPMGRGGRDDRTGPSFGSRRLVPPESDGEIETMIRKQTELRAQIDAVLSEPVDIPAPRSSRRGSQLGVLTPDDEIALKAPTRALEFDIQPEAIVNSTGPFAPPPDSSRSVARTQGGFTPPAPSSGRMPVAPPSSGRIPAAPPSGPQPPPSFRQPPPSDPILLESLPRPEIKLGGAAIPEARDVLDALELAGVYERDAVAVPQVFPWTKPEVVRSKKSIGVLVGLAVALLAGGATTFVMVTNARARDRQEAEQLLVQVDKDLEQADAKLLDPAEKSIAKAFELDSRSPHAALTWLHERVTLGLLKGGGDIAFEEATARAKEVGIEEKRYAFAHVASFLFQGDTAGAIANVAKWDERSGDDPWFHLVAGATFERAGDPRALERYAAAVKLAPDMLTAQILLNRAMAVDGDVKRATELAKEIRIRHPQRLESAALVVLAWARDPRGEPPAETREVIEHADALPLALRSVPFAARAVLAVPKGMQDEAKSSTQKGLNLADTPGMATWFGGIALMTGDEDLARKAAVTALSFSAAYAPARILAARVALFAARFDEALKATEELPQSSPEVALVSAAASYEKLDAERLGRSFDALSDEARKHPYIGPLHRGQALLAGKLDTFADAAKALEAARDEAPWADLVSIDWALESGDLETAKKIAEAWRGEPRAMRAVRLARLARYEGKLEDADRLSRIGLEAGTPTLRALAERVYTLIALKRDADAAALFKTYSNLGGPLAKWLRAYAQAIHGKADDAKAIVATEDPPPTAAPMPTREIAAMAYGAMKTRKADDYVKAIVQAGFTNPDMVWAAERVGLPKIAAKKPR